MQDNDGNASIRIRLDISVHPGSNVIVDHQAGAAPKRAKDLHFYSTEVSHPTPGGTTQAKQVNSRWYICVYGNTETGIRHIFAKAYDGSVTTAPVEPPSGDMDVLWTRPNSATKTWKFDLLPVPGNMGVTKTLIVWTDNGCSYSAQTPINFTPQSSTSTYCESYSGVAPLVLPQKQDWATLPERWHFAVKGCSNASLYNCNCLNGEWVLTRDRSAGTELLWQRMLNTSIADPSKPSWWRLLFNRVDGFWYLENVSSLEQPTGTSITYRRHESAWDPHGANVMLLVTNHGYCQVPEAITLVPA